MRILFTLCFWAASGLSAAAFPPECVGPDGGRTVLFPLNPADFHGAPGDADYWQRLVANVTRAGGFVALSPANSWYTKYFRKAAVHFATGPLRETACVGPYRFVLLVTPRTDAAAIEHELIHVRDNFDPNFGYGEGALAELANFSQSEVNAYREGTLPYRRATRSFSLDEYLYYLIHRTRLHFVRAILRASFVDFARALFDLALVASLVVLALFILDTAIAFLIRGLKYFRAR